MKATCCRPAFDCVLRRCVVLAVVTALTALAARPRADASNRFPGIRRLTAPSGLQTGAAWSPDGEFIAYASDQSGAFNIWIQRSTGAGDPRRITTGPDDDWQPQWAPDGKSLVFRSERDGGGLFIVDAEGAQVRQLTTFGYHPQWSPDGRRILFSGRHLSVMRQRQEFYVVAVSGGEPRQVTADVADGFTTTPEACWHPDGKRITIAGIDRQRVVIRTFSAEAEKGAFSEIDWTKDTDNPVYAVDGVMWARTGDALFVIGKDFGGARAWRMTIDPTSGKRRGTPQDIVARANGDIDISLAPDGTRAAFTLAHVSTPRLRAYPLDSAQGRLTGSPRTITPTNAAALAPDYTVDGKKLAYVLIPPPLPGRPLVRELHEMTEAGDRILIADDTVRFGPRWSHDGRFISYRRTPAESRVTVATVLDTTTMRERQLTSPQVFATPFGWSADDKSIVTTFVHPASGRYALFRLDVTGQDWTPLMVQQRYDLWQGTYSPDGRWVAFVVQEPEPRWSAIFVMRAAGGAPIQITDGRGWDDKPRWSADGRLLYFVTSHGGPFGVDAIRVNSETGQAEGIPLHVLSLHAPREQMLSDVAWMEMALARDAVALPIVERTGSLWTTTSAETAMAPTESTENACQNLEPPQAVRKVTPSYSREALSHKLSGTVDLEALVETDGTVRRIQVVQSTDVRLEPEALRSAAEWTFRPARCGTEIVSATTRLQIAFDRK